ncbi:hypothetical protein QVD17_18333 [Tagetes erecta]|uniref:Uncharacterized protein n=1 Tax=Tagetes erecta TaxID=13708 RepID=A0AAD8KNV9_TARER|nr:hypothetical protein QVD17_18333 [Tagetes erecta]
MFSFHRLPDPLSKQPFFSTDRDELNKNWNSKTVQIGICLVRIVPSVDASCCRKLYLVLHRMFRRKRWCWIWAPLKYTTVSITPADLDLGWFPVKKKVRRLLFRWSVLSCGTAESEHQSSDNGGIVQLV